MSAATINLSYALAEDAARVCALVERRAARVVGDCATLAYFNYDRPLLQQAARHSRRQDRRNHRGL